VTSLLPFRWHLAEVAFVVVVGVAHHRAVTSTRERRLARYALLALLVVTVWPMGDLASSVSLTAATVQRLVIMLLVAPLLLMATPTELLARLTRPRPIDALTRLLAHPGVAMVLVTVLGTATLAPVVVGWGAHSAFVRDLVLLVVLLVGVVLWLPGLGVLPGARRLSPAARAGYLFASSLVVTSLSLIWILARHPLYPALQNQYSLVHMTPLLDQQVAGFVAKFGCYIPVWSVAFTMFFHAEEDGPPGEETPLHWADVERQLLRIDRQRERAARRHRTR
jgi:cytochrome c oxidase assembly factor CtaG